MSCKGGRKPQGAGVKDDSAKPFSSFLCSFSLSPHPSLTLSTLFPLSFTFYPFALPSAYTPPGIERLAFLLLSERVFMWLRQVLETVQRFANQSFPLSLSPSCFSFFLSCLHSGEDTRFPESSKTRPQEVHSRGSGLVRSHKYLW